nr:RecName: Full=Cutinase 1; AltName: Full=Cutin hydrolase 1 [Colletotrichum kahawae]
VIYIFAR